ncbi:hypothetical protein OEZ85_011492 [Tetradesmus obliquus]|uniref:Cyanobacterial aminoacyl-tRNA synthetase CAAD domain-containing protein n=1 Tax=Tetradesmus obliquus TaxID=3088 RepID=A0ABY8TUE0_TETOB|nr:hypothetical protein OEZ85_011492 [Tetradesmus obliquus]
MADIESQIISHDQQWRVLRTASARVPVVPARLVRPAPQPSARVVVRAESKDFDAYLAEWADKFEKTENKPVVIGWVAAAVSAFFIAEWLIHLPALDVVLGFPVQLVGLLTLPYLAVRWYVDGNDASKDIEAAAGSIIKKLPGLEKK